MSFKYKFLFFINSILFVFAIYLLSFAIPVRAQVPSPAPIPCSSTDNPEFHSLRPYQASPCQTTVAPDAKFCGNNLTLHTTISESYPGSGTCSETNGVVTCNYNESPTDPVTIDLSGATLPFLGNTEDVLNSQNSSESATDAEKVNDYVSWYLNGVTNRAEYGDTKNTDSNNINLSGPLNKLLPGAILDAQRIQSINNVASNTNHNQIVVCTQNGKPSPCYNGDTTPAQGTIYRLGDWNDGSLSPLTTFFNWLGTDIWNKKYPPLPWQFKSEILYEKAYNEWEGRTCVILPILNTLACATLPVVSNPSTWANLFPYVPLSSTEDIPGDISIDSASPGSQTAGVSVSNVSFSGQTPAELFFPHVQETNELGSSLQSTFVSKDLSQAAAAGSAPSDVACVSTEARSGRGDNLFAKQIGGTLHYSVSFSCNFNPIINSTDPACITKCLRLGDPRDICNAICVIPQPPQSCTKDVFITLTTKSSSPQLDDLWSTLVAGPTSIFRRLAPQVGTNGPIACILDIPGSTNVSYQGSGVSTDATVNLPHLGGISAYFMQGIQTMLRPKGYGTDLPSTSNTSLCINTAQAASTDICSGSCNSSPASVDISGLKQKFIDLATRWLGVGHPRIDKFDEVVSAAQSAGVDPIFTLAIWLNESGASNYDGVCIAGGHSDPNSVYCQRAQDFGINSSSVETQYKPDGTIIQDHFEDQLHTFLNLPSAYLQTCTGNTTAKCPMQIFGAMFKPGQCNPTDNSNAYIAGIKQIYNWLKPSQTFACYPIAIPK